ncbi:MAG: flagellar filament protein FlaA [Spirochaetales bacterium]|nr:flagellar filament protein FlaA [Spirochaetales bacterium]
MKKLAIIFVLTGITALAWSQTATTAPANTAAAGTAQQPAQNATQPTAQSASQTGASQGSSQNSGGVQSATGVASNNSSVSAPQPAEIGINSAQQDLREVSVDKFEDDGFWQAKMPRDDGLIFLRRFEGAPAERKPIPGDVKESDKYVLGVKVEFLHRAVTNAEIIPIRPIPIPGITKTVSIWVVGRNVNNQLYLIVTDHFGNLAKIYMGSLAFTGWKKLTAAIPPNIRQADPRYNDRQGITVQELQIEFDPSQTYGTYYIYFDDLTAVVDLFAENNRDPDDMSDAW